MSRKRNNYVIPDIDYSTDKVNDELVTHSVKDDDRLYTFSFAHYKENKCEIEKISKCGHAVKALRWFRDVGLSDTIEGTNIYKTIINKGNYAFLFNGLEEDAEIKEYRISDKGRIFFYVDEANKIVNIVLIKNAHINIS